MVVMCAKVADRDWWEIFSFPIWDIYTDSNIYIYIYGGVGGAVEEAPANIVASLRPYRGQRLLNIPVNK